MTSKVIEGMATPRGKYPHWKRAGDFILVSGISSRRPDNTFEGVTTDVAGATVPDIRAQTRAVILNIRKILESAGAGLEDLVQVTCFLVDMKDFPGYNEAYGEFFSHGGPTRTTVAVRELPHPSIIIEINGMAFKPE